MKRTIIIFLVVVMLMMIFTSSIGLASDKWNTTTKSYSCLLHNGNETKAIWFMLFIKYYNSLKLEDI